MSLATTLNTLQRKPVMATGDMPISLETISGFENLQRMARMFVTVPFVPDTFRAPYTDEKGKRRGCSSIEEAIGCYVVALDMAMRMKANPLAVMQNIYVVHGRPAWTAQFLLATLNNSGRFSTIRYKFQGTQGKDDWGCRAVAKELTTGEIVEGPLITIGLAKHEGWFKNSSKWQSMPDLMLRYRAVSWFVRVHAQTHLLDVQHHVGHVLKDAVDGGELMLHAGNLHRHKGSTLQGGKQHTTHGIADGGAVSPLQRFANKLAVRAAGRVFVAQDLVGLDELAPVARIDKAFALFDKHEAPAYFE